jgi:hypothetical protein
VVIPSSTEEVQKIVKIANEHKVPVVPLTGGFNHGGLTIPRKGGILIDLRKRMDKILNVDEESMTMTIQPGVACATAYAEATKRYAIDDIPLRAIIPLTPGSVSLLSNMISRGGSARIPKAGTYFDSIVNITWVLPDGEILKLGPSSLPNVGLAPVAYGPGPGISGMLNGAYGMFGMCTEMTIKILPEKKLYRFYFCTPGSPEGSLEKCVDFIYKLMQEDIVDFMYKTGACTTLAGIHLISSDLRPEDMVEMMPEDVIFGLVGGDTEEEVEIKYEILQEIMEQSGMMQMDVQMLLAGFGGGAINELLGKLGVELKEGEDLGMAMNRVFNKFSAPVGAIMHGGRGSFQFIACMPKLEKIPEIARDFYRVVEKYWLPDPTLSRKRLMTGTVVQGPFPFARCGTLENDFYWDPGNPEVIKKATEMYRKVTEVNARHGAMQFRHMNNGGEIELPLLGTYYEVLKETKRLFDPDNLMHPDIDPVTEDYV